ncbi:hypothetical protein [Aliiroseovarius sediminilitoris]|uniref:hypothetical protein n=1 Tax=Aliiroseovarius sediminilitoris TaxID=1173584 RepID=UPI000B851CB7|nr:hypothetical protein [Aliiroseovarius sediminilitoris]
MRRADTSASGYRFRMGAHPRKAFALRGLASVLAATAAGLGRFVAGGFRDARLGLGLRLRFGLATATSRRILGGFVLSLGVGTVVHLDLLLFAFIL